MAVLSPVCPVAFLYYDPFSSNYSPSTCVYPATFFHSKWTPSVITVDPLVIQLDGLHVDGLNDVSTPHEPLSTLHGYLTEQVKAYAGYYEQQMIVTCVIVFESSF